MARDIHVVEEYWLDFNDLLDKCWSGAVDTLKDIEAAGVEDEFMDYLNEALLYEEDVVDMTDLNDFIWFERDAIYEACGLDENGNPIEDVEEEYFEEDE